ncbi:MAG: tetratricopeptide repeat protein [Candidatus Kapabacteria bacterium]|nr:tetratricopeptide repeat protein [Candidatus Kapabacteria bacterium]
MKKIFYSALYLIIGALLAQSFQCASYEMTNGNLSYKNKDWSKARDYYLKEIKNNPKSEEAWILLGEVYTQLNEFEEAAKSFSQAEKIVVNPISKQKLDIDISNLWRKSYNASIDTWENYLNFKQSASLDSTLKLINIALILRPNNSSFYNIKAMALEAKGDTAGSIENYLKFIDIEQPNISIAREKGFYVDMPLLEAQSKLGKPSEPIAVFPQDDKSPDSLHTCKYSIKGKELYIFAFSKGQSSALIKGWRFDPPEAMPLIERSQFSQISAGPYASLISYYTGKNTNDGNETALMYLKSLLTIQPSNVEANSLLISLYQRSGKNDVAMKTIKEMAEKNPTNKWFTAQYGDILMMNKNYDEAIQQYEKALKIDANFAEAMKNMAIGFKNKAGAIQEKQRKEMDQDPNLKMDPKQYFPFIEKSRDINVKYLATEKGKLDIEAMEELINCYEVLDDKDNLQKAVQKIVSLENSVADKNIYYETLYKMFDRIAKLDPQYKEKLNYYRQKYDENRR